MLKCDLLFSMEQSCSLVIDNVHLFGLKRYLGADRRTPNDLVYGEVGRFPI